MRFRVTNLGPLREAEIDLAKPLIILTGPNNSGKTYLAWVAYSLATMEPRLVDVPPALRQWAQQLWLSENRTLPLDSLLTIIPEILVGIARKVKARLPADFAAPREYFTQSQIELFDSDEGYANTLLETQIRPFADHDGNIIIAWFIPKETNIGTTLSLATQNVGPQLARFAMEQDENSVPLAQNAAASFAISVVHQRARGLGWFAFPVERLAINLFVRELAANRIGLIDELLDDTSTTSLQSRLRQGATRYPRAIRDAIQRAIKAHRANEPGPLCDLADELEASILSGRITANAQDELEFIPDLDTAKFPLGLHQSASMIKSLASLVLYLRHEAHPGQRLLIDEPELNLHPDNQRRVARILAKAVNRGLKVFMSTHSDYMIREFNNLIMLGQDSEPARALVQELGYDPQSTLRSEQLGVYLVNEGECTPLPITETGFEIKTIDDEVHKLNRDSQTIYMRLFGE
ncbi:MAG: AAA family ATPase [Deltaproteobacteria bacterium]|nr:AAA family ATPase [Deltaproteobacteria bacterium]